MCRGSDQFLGLFGFGPKMEDFHLFLFEGFPNRIWSCLYSMGQNNSIHWALLFSAWFKWRLQENRFFSDICGSLSTLQPPSQGCIFISMNPKPPGYPSILNKSNWYPLLGALSNVALFETHLLDVWNSSGVGSWRHFNSFNQSQTQFKTKENLNFLKAAFCSLQQDKLI